MQNFPSGLYHFWRNKKRMFVTRPRQAHTLTLFLHVLLGSAPNLQHIATNHGQERKPPELQTGHTISNAIAICKREKKEGRRKGSLLTRERKVGALRIIRWEFKGGPNLRCNQASGPRSASTRHFFILSSTSEQCFLMWCKGCTVSFFFL